jgi:hypothetical protein
MKMISTFLLALLAIAIAVVGSAGIDPARVDAAGPHDFPTD